MTGIFKILLCALLLIIISSGKGDCTGVSIVLSSADENVTVRSTVLLVCVAYGGSSAPSIVWYRNGNPINNATDLRTTVYNSMTTSSGLVFAESILEICSIGLDEGGEYMCNASNGADSYATNITTLTVLERGEPDRPCNCSSVPVYSEAGALTSIEFNWTKVANPPMVVPGVNPDITSYNVSVNGIGAHIVPVEGVCMESNSQMPCSYSYPVPSFKASLGAGGIQFDGNVAAVNEVGRGRTCSPSLNSIGQMSSYKNIMMLSVDTSGGRVKCEKGQGLSPDQAFSCDFCHSSTTSCQGTMSCRQVLDSTNTVDLPKLSEGTYCYRATAFLNGSPAAVVQDTFNIRQQAAGVPLVASLAGSITTSFIVAFVIGLLAGCLPCLCYYHKRDTRRVCLNCTNSGIIGGGGESKETGVYETIPLPEKEKDINVSTNEAYGRLPTMNPVW